MSQNSSPAPDTPNEPLPSPAPFIDTDTSAPPPSSTISKKLIALFVLFFIVLFGFFGHFLGAGWFFYRNILFGSGELYALNLSADPLWVVVDDHKPVEVRPDDARILPILGGTSQVTVHSAPSEPPIATHSITTDHSHAFLKLSSDGCLVVVDLDPYYGSANATDEIHFTDTIKADQHLWIPNSTNVVWPRKSFPPSLSSGDGPGRWIELVACTLLEDTEDDRKFLDAYIALRLQERMTRAKTASQSRP